MQFLGVWAVLGGGDFLQILAFIVLGVHDFPELGVGCHMHAEGDDIPGSGNVHGILESVGVREFGEGKF